MHFFHMRILLVLACTLCQGSRVKLKSEILAATSEEKSSTEYTTNASTVDGQECRGSWSCGSPSSCPQNQRCKSDYTSYRQDCGAGCGKCACKIDYPDVTIHVDSIHRTTSDNFLGVTIDSVYINRYNFKDPEFIKLTSNLVQGGRGSILRIGGTDADRNFMKVGDAQPYSNDHHNPLGIPGNAGPGEIKTADGYAIRMLDVSLFDDLYAFAKATGNKILWDLNALGTRLSDNTWDKTNAEQLFDHIKQKGYDKEGVLVGFQFGNEPWLNYANPLMKLKTPPKWVDGKSLGKDFKRMQSLAAQKGLDGMRLQGSDMCCYPSDYLYSSPFVGEVRGVPNFEFSFHLYPLTSCDPNAFVNGGDPAGIAYYQNMAKTWGFNGKVILSETSAHNAGCGGVSDRFVHSLWFVDYMGRAADDHGIWEMYRQSLFTPTSYGLAITDGANINRVTPDYYVTVLWRKLVGASFLSIDGRGGNLRVYSACTPPNPGLVKGTVTLIYANFNDFDTKINLAVASGAGTTQYKGRIAEYRLESDGDWLSQDMKLNGEKLTPDSSFKVHVTTASGDAIPIAGRSLGFFVLLEAHSSVC